MNNLAQIKKTLGEHVDQRRADFSPKFFKTGPGEYAEGDMFLGVPVPAQRRVAKKFYQTVTLGEAIELLKSKWHEERLTALFILVLHYQKGDKTIKNSVVTAYLANTTHISNWDLVDSSASYILGNWLLDKDRSVLQKLAVSPTLWERRIAMIATLEFIRYDEFDDTIHIAELLMSDKHDLIHKAVGWCLREVGKRDSAVLIAFLDRHATHMPRTALRYAVERLPEQQRKYYLNLR